MTQTSGPPFHDSDENWSKIAESINELLGESGPSQNELREVFVAQREIIASLASRVSTSGESFDVSLREAVVDLILVQLYKSRPEEILKRAVVAALWSRLSETITFIATQVLGGVRRVSKCQDRLDDLTQDAFFVFEDKLQKFELGKNVRLQTFMKTCFRNHLINLAKRGSAKDRNEKAELPEQTIDKKDLEREQVQIDEERLKTVEDLLNREAERNPDVAERIEAFRKYRLGGSTMEIVANEMGRSVGWVHKCSERIEKLLREELRD